MEDIRQVSAIESIASEAETLIRKRCIEECNSVDGAFEMMAKVIDKVEDGLKNG